MKLPLLALTLSVALAASSQVTASLPTFDFHWRMKGLEASSQALPDYGWAIDDKFSGLIVAPGESFSFNLNERVIPTGTSGLVWSSPNLPAWASLDGSTGRLTGTAPNTASSTGILLNASMNGNSDSANVPLSVTATTGGGDATDGGTVEDGNGTGSDLVPPTDLNFAGDGNEVTGNAGGAGSVTVVNNSSGETLGSGTSGNDGDFSITLEPTVKTGDELTITVSSGSGGSTVTEMTLVTVPDYVGPLDDAIWRAYGVANGFSKGAHIEGDEENSTWHSLSWNTRSLSNLPTEPYPLRVINGSIQLGQNNIDQIDGFRKVVKARHISLHMNKLTNLDGLSSLVEAGGLRLYQNNISDISGLSSLELVQGGSLELNSNNLTNVDGLGNLKSAFKVSLHNNNLTNLNGLSSLKKTNSISAKGNPNLVDISGLRNIDGLHAETLELTISFDLDIAEREGFIGIPNTSWVCQPNPMINTSRSAPLSEICVE